MFTLAFSLALSCGGWSDGLVVDVVNATDEQFRGMQMTVYSMNRVFSYSSKTRPGKHTNPRFIFLRQKDVWGAGEVGNVVVSFVPWMPDLAVGVTIRDVLAHRGTILIWDQLAGKDLQEVVVHELGHLFGLEHSANPKDIMFPYSSAENFNEAAFNIFRDQLLLCDE